MLENPSSRVRREVLVQRVLLQVERGAVRVHRREEQREVCDARGRDDDADVHREHAPESEKERRGGGRGEGGLILIPDVRITSTHAPQRLVQRERVDVAEARRDHRDVRPVYRALERVAPRALGHDLAVRAELEEPVALRPRVTVALPRLDGPAVVRATRRPARVRRGAALDGLDRDPVEACLLYTSPSPRD